MGCILSCVSEILYMGEKFALYLACTALVICLILTLIAVLGMGIGLGYNYCFVDLKTKFKYVPGRYIYPGEPPYDTIRRHGNGPYDPYFEQKGEEDAITEAPLSEQPSAPTSTMSNSPKGMRMNRQMYLENNETTIENNQTVSSDTKSLNETTSLNVTQSLLAALLDAVKKHAENTKSSQNITETNGTTITSAPITFFSTVSTTESKLKIKNETDKPTSEPIIVDEPSSRKVKKLVIPISGLDLISLLSTLRAENKNYSLQLLTT